MNDRLVAFKGSYNEEDNKGRDKMNETASLQKQDLSHIDHKLDEIVELLLVLIELLKAKK